MTSNLNSADKVSRMLAKLEVLWRLNPNLRFGELIEKIEDVAWEFKGIRYCSARLMNIEDENMEVAIDVMKSKYK